MDVRFLTGPADEIKKAKLNWVVLPTELPASTEPTSARLDQDPSTPPGDGFFQNRPRTNRAQFVTEKCLPMIYNIMADEAAANLFHQWNSAGRNNILQAPKTTILNGQSSFIADCSQTPFVIELKDGQPQIRVVHEGAVLQFRPLADANGALKMDFRVEFSKIGSVETIELSPKRDGKPAATQTTNAAVTRAEGTIQIPEVSMTRVEGSVDLPWDQWLLLGGVDAVNGGAKPITFVMLRAEKIEPFNVPPKQDRPVDSISDPAFRGVPTPAPPR